MTRHSESARELTLADNRVTLRGPADLADALPYLLGYHPDDSIVLVGLHGPRGRVGGRIRTGIPADPDGWAEAAEQLAACLADSGAVRGSRPDAAVVYLCQEPPDGVRPKDAMERLRPLAQGLRTACGAREVPVYEAIYVTRERYWSYCCADADCCADEGNALPRAGTSPMAAAAAYAGIQVRGSLGELRRRLAPLGGPVAATQVRAFDTVAAELYRRILDVEPETAAVRGETLRLAERVVSRFRRALPPKDADAAAADAGDDALITSPARPRRTADRTRPGRGAVRTPAANRARAVRRRGGE